jgi:hypothetical protein
MTSDEFKMSPGFERGIITQELLDDDIYLSTCVKKILIKDSSLVPDKPGKEKR